MSDEMRDLAERVEQGTATPEQLVQLDAMLEAQEQGPARTCVQGLP